MPHEGLAFDRATVRRVDADGRLHVEISNISKAAVNPYFGREIPGGEAMGLDPDRIYQLLRDPGELAKAVATFNNIPLLSKHVAVSAADPQKEYIVGSTGTDAEFAAPFLRNSLVVWDASAIAGIQTNEQRELSSAYRYVADMTPGVYEGVPYDGRMTDIVGNHVALVPVGRAGADVLVSDSLPEELTPMKLSKAAAARAALHAVLLPQLAQDSAPADIRKLTAKVTTAQKLAEDAAKAFPEAKIDVAALTKSIQFALDEADEEPKKPDTAEDEDDEDKKAEDEDDEKKAEDEDDEKDEQKAMDAATVALIRADAKKDALQAVKALREAEADVRPLVGEIAAMDSAEDVYRFAMDQLGIEHKGVHPSAYKALIAMAKTKTDKKPDSFAMDAAHSSDFAKRFPKAGRVLKV